MTRCTSERIWHQGRGPSDPRRGRIHQCTLTAGHDGPCAYEPTQRWVVPEPSTYVQPAPREVVKVDLGKLFRENARRKAWGR
jgi:hypothetical protein